MREGKLSLRVVLQNFINNVESLEASKNTKEDKYEQEFQELKKLTESLKNHPDFVCLEGEKECNRRKNRYKDILPYDKTRVVLQPFPSIPGSDYVNANFIRGASGSRAYIASQGPLANTVPDFWRMVVECDVQVIVMASNETEGGKHKCECYWVEAEGEEKQFGNVLVSFVKSRQVCPDFLVRTLKIQFTSEKNKTEERTICQFHYMLWPDHGVPDTVRPLLDMVRLVRDCQASETLPVLVHCSAGCGRTGTICAIDYVWGLLRTGKLTDNLYLLGLVREMRVQRVAMVQTREQYTLLHQAVKELFKERLSLIDSHPYENINTDGNPLFLKTLKDKESDYEELFVSQEKQDKSTKASTPSSTPTSVSTPSGSLTRKPAELPSALVKDNLKRTLSTGSLDKYHAPPLSGKAMMALTPFNATLSESSIEKRIAQSMLTLESDIMRLKMVTSVPDKSHISVKRPPSGHSKMEKEAENLAQKMEAKDREKKRRSSAAVALYSQRSSLSNNSTPSDTPLTTPTATPNSTPNPLQGIGLLSLQTPPLPPPRSRTPSPIIAIRKVIENEKKKLLQHQQHQQSQNQPNLQQPIYYSSQTQLLDQQGSPKVKRKNGELIRRPSIQKLKELFDRPSSHTIICPNGSKLCRSASSVTSRPGLSVHNDMTMSLKVKRKGSLGWDEPFPPLNKSSKDDSSKLQICPPPPPINETSSAFHPVMATRKSSGHSFSSRVMTKFKPNIENDFVDVKNSTLLLNVDDRPALPLKKSKSFRWSRPHCMSSSGNSNRSPEISRKGFDTYFSLDRPKAEPCSSVESCKPEGNMKRLANDFPSPHEGLKLSVYEFSHGKGLPSSACYSSEESLGTKNDTKPLIPPKKYIGDKHKNSQMRLPVQNCYKSSSKESLDPSISFSQPNISQLPVQPDSSYENPVFWESCSENLYDNFSSQQELPKLKHNIEPQHFDSTDESKNSPIECSNTFNFPSVPQSNKDYVNARVFKTNFDISDSPKYVYVPLPSKRTIKDKEHDYANCNVSSNAQVIDSNDNFTSAEFVLHNLTENVNPSTTSVKPNGVKSKISKNSVESKRSDCAVSSPFFSDYEPVDFGESATTNIDEVFETVNYELLQYEEKQKKKMEQSSKRDYYLNKDLDSIAIKVYKDCQEYLLHGNNRSPVPSLMPKTSGKEDSGLQVERATEARIQSLEDKVTDLEEVRSKVTVPPQGLRSRERRNSYRQAVSLTSPSYSKVLGNPRTTIHKYEKIWFEAPKGDMGNDEGTSRNEREEGCDMEPLKLDYSANLNRHMNISGKESMFKDKLQELQSYVSSFDRKKLTDLSEEELSSKDSGSTSSLLSRSAQSSRSSERTEPIYVNTPFVLRPPSPNERSTKSEMSLVSGRQSNPLVTGASPYGTLATTTSYPYKPKLNPPFQNEADGSIIPFRPTHTATLPARSSVSTPSAKSILPPKEFRNISTTTTASDQAVLRNERSSESTSPAYYDSSQFDGQLRTQPLDRNKGRRKHGNKVYYSKIPPNVIPSKSHLPSKMKSHSGIRGDCSVNANGIPKNILRPTAPPRIKRNSAVGCVLVPAEAVSTLNPQLLRCSSEKYENKNKSPSSPIIQNDLPSIERAVPYSQGHSSNSQSSVHPSLNPSVFYHHPPPPKPIRNNSGPPKQDPNKNGATKPLVVNSSSVIVKPSKRVDIKEHPNRRSVDLDQVGKPQVDQVSLKSAEKLNRKSMDQDQINRMIKENVADKADQTGQLPRNGIKLQFPNDAPESNAESISSMRIELGSETSSTDTSMEEEGIFHKITAPNFLRKLRSNQVKVSSNTGKSSVASKATFYPSKEGKNDAESEQKARATISPPASPRPLTKAFGKLKMGSISVAANFKSYLNIKGSSDEPSGSFNRHNPLQKSISCSGPTITVFSQVVEDCKYPNSIPKKPIGPKELPENFRCYTNNPTNEGKINRPRQQYL